MPPTPREERWDAPGPDIVRRHLVPMLLVAAACLLAIWPGPLARGALGHPTGDMPDHFWGSWWFGSELLAGRLPLHTSTTAVPGGGTLWYPDPLGALMALPFRAFGPDAAWNSALCLQAVLAGLVGYGLGYAFSGRRTGGMACGVVCGASPFGLSLAWSGLSEYAGLAWPALFTWTLLRALDTGERPFRVAIAALLCTLQSSYYGAFALLLAACHAVFHRDRAGLLLRALGAWALMAAPFLGVAWYSLHAPDALVGPDSAPGWSQGSPPATDLLSWVHPGRWYHPDTPSLGNPGILHVNYLGAVLLAAAILAILRDRRARSILPGTALYLLLALGPVLSWNRHPVTLAGRPVPLPLALFYLPGSPFRLVHHPYRMVAFLLPALGMLAASARLPRLPAILLPAAMLAETLLVSPARWPIPATRTAPAPVEARLPGPGGVVDLPPDATTGNRRYLAAQVHHGRPIPYGLNLFLPARLLADPLVGQVLRALDDPRARARNRDVPHRGPVLVRPATRDTMLGAFGFRWVLLHRDLLSARERRRVEAVLRRWLGAPVRQEGDLVLYELGWSSGSARTAVP